MNLARGGACIRGFRTPEGNRNPSQKSDVRASEKFAESGHFAFHITNDCEGVESGLTAFSPTEDEAAFRHRKGRSSRTDFCT